MQSIQAKHVVEICQRQSFRAVFCALLVSAVPFTGASAQSKFSERAIASIEGCSDGNIRGFATLQERASAEGVKEIDVYLFVSGLSEGKHAVHIHETGVCEPCGEAKGHFDPGNFSESNPDANHPYHSGDLININSENGNGVMMTSTNRITLSGGPLSLFDHDGSAFIVHDNPDSYCPGGEEAGCAGGSRAACGIIKKVKTSDQFKLMVSRSSGRYDAVELADAELNGGAYIFLSPVYPHEPIDSVAYYFDGQRHKVEYYAPYDFNGTHRSGSSSEYYTPQSGDGAHNVAAVVTFASGERTFVSAEFSIDNDRGRFGNGRSRSHDNH